MRAVHDDVDGVHQLTTPVTAPTRSGWPRSRDRGHRVGGRCAGWWQRCGPSGVADGISHPDQPVRKWRSSSNPGFGHPLRPDRSVSRDRPGHAVRRATRHMVPPSGRHVGAAASAVYGSTSADLGRLPDQRAHGWRTRTPSPKTHRCNGSPSRPRANCRTKVDGVATGGPWRMACGASALSPAGHGNRPRSAEVDP